MQVSMRRLMLLVTVACILLGLAVSYVIPHWSHYWFYRGTGFDPPEWATVAVEYSWSSHALGSLIGGVWLFRYVYLTFFPIAILLTWAGQKMRRARPCDAA